MSLAMGRLHWIIPIKVETVFLYFEEPTLHVDLTWLFHRVVTVSKTFSRRTLIELEIYFSPLFKSFPFFVSDTSNSICSGRNGIRFYLLSSKISITAVFCNLSGTRGQTGKLRESKRRCSRRHAILHLRGNRAQLLVNGMESKRKWCFISYPSWRNRLHEKWNAAGRQYMRSVWASTWFHEPGWICIGSRRCTPVDIGPNVIAHGGCLDRCNPYRDGDSRLKYNYPSQI